jgi:hypothetical protein
LSEGHQKSSPGAWNEYIQKCSQKHKKQTALRHAAKTFKQHAEALTPAKQQVRSSLLTYLNNNAPDLHVDTLSLDVLRTLKKQVHNDLKENRKTARDARKAAAEADKYYKLVSIARMKAGYQHKRGQITSFDYREADDTTILDWYEEFKRTRKERKSKF